MWQSPMGSTSGRRIVRNWSNSFWGLGEKWERMWAVKTTVVPVVIGALGP